MIQRNDMYSLAEFQANSAAHLERLARTGAPQVITVDGKPAVIIQDVAAYQKLIEELDRAEAIAGIQRGLDDMAAGGGRPLKEFFTEFAEKHGLPSLEP
jgi:prevent-host-death family protein